MIAVKPHRAGRQWKRPGGLRARRRWDIESSFHVEKNGGCGLEHNFCNKARASRNIYLLMQKKGKYRNMTQVKWAELIRALRASA